ncbi:MAG: nucleotide sugar dehydrogenase [Alphaproteobacteria bacterium]
MTISSTSPKIAVIGLGYVGLPLAISLAKHFDVIGFDINQQRIHELKAGYDRTREIREDVLRAAKLYLTSKTQDIQNQDIYIVTVPTPVDSSSQPDLSAVKSACRTVGSAMKPGAIIVFESTVYPGVTEDICGPLLAEVSGLICGRDFYLGYSPERINPGDREHTVEKITKVVAGQTPEVAQKLKNIYGRITSGGIFLARDIKTAEAAKVIENAQRDINIAFINEITRIFHALGLSVHDVLEAAQTKWNFLPFVPGLVGGHCIGVDPYYLAYCSESVGHHPQVILAGRRTNDAMGQYIADQIIMRCQNPGAILILGLTFKENVPDLRNSKVIDIIRGLQSHGRQVVVHDPLADPLEAQNEYGIELIKDMKSKAPYAAIVGAVAHQDYVGLSLENLKALLIPQGLVADVKGIWKSIALPSIYQKWQL